MFEWGVIGAFLFGLFLLAVIVKVFFLPLKFLFRILVNGLIGGLLLLFINTFGTMVGVTIPINPITALVAGFLGIPGVLLLIILQYIIV